MDVIANGVRLHYLESGTSTGPPVILIHGNGLTHEVWRHLVPELRDRYRVLTPHLRGMGDSEAAGHPGRTVRNEDHAADLLAFMDAVGVERAVLVGHAFGGFVSLRVAIDRPERVAGLILVDTSARIEGRTRESLPRWSEVVEREGLESLIEPAMDRWFVKRVHTEEPDTIELYRRMVRANPWFGYAANCRGIMQYDVRQELHRISAPTLVVAGTEDYSISLEDKRGLAEGIPGARLVPVEDASHTVPEEQPDQFNRDAAEFLREVHPDPDAAGA